MRKPILVTTCIILFLFLIPVSYADLTDDCIVYYSFDEGEEFIDIARYKTNLTNYITEKQAGIINDSRFGDGGNEYMVGSNNLPETYDIPELTISFWTKYQHLLDQSFYVVNRDSSVAYDTRFDGSSIFHFRVFNSSGQVATTDSSISMDDNTWHHFVGVKNTTHLLLYIDGVLNDTVAFEGNVDIPSGTPSFNVGQNNAPGIQDMDGNIDEVGIWNRSLSQSEVSELYNSGDGFQYPFLSDFLTLNFYNLTPQNQTNFSSNSVPFYLNFTVNVTGSSEDMVSCYLEEGGTIIESVYQNVTDESLFNITRTFSSELNYTTYEYNLSCNHTATTTTSYNPKYIGMFIDTTTPLLEINNPTNSTVIWNPLEINVTGRDNNLFNMSVDIQDEAGTFYMFQESVDFINTTTWNITDTIANLTDYSRGMYNLTARICDGHTDKFIQPIDNKVDLNSKKITYDEAKTGINIEYKSAYPVADIKTTKLDDRYTFDFMLQDKSKTKRIIIFEVSSKYPIYHISNSKYKGHLITGKYWIDFDLPNLDKKAYSVSRIDQNTYRVTINTDVSQLKFSSIGELNCLTNYVYFEVNDSSVPEATLDINDTEIQTGESVMLNWSCYDNIGIDYTLMKITNPDTTVFYSNSTNPNGTETFSSGIIQTGTYQCSFFCNDTSGNSNTTYKNFSVNAAPPELSAGVFTVTLFAVMVFGLLLIIALGIWTENTIFYVMGGVLGLILAGILFTNGLSVEVGTNATVIGDTTTEANVYAQAPSYTSYFGLFFILVSIWLFTKSYRFYKQKKNEEQDNLKALSERKVYKFPRE